MNETRRPAIYIASRASVVERPMLWNKIREDGYNVISTWHNPENMEHFEPKKKVDLRFLWGQIEREVAVCDALMIYATPHDLPLKGAFVEAGMALAMGKPVYVVYALSGDPDVLRQHLGSWVAHPNVMVCESIDTALFCIERRITNDTLKAARR